MAEVRVMEFQLFLNRCRLPPIVDGNACACASANFWSKRTVEAIHGQPAALSETDVVPWRGDRTHRWESPLLSPVQGVRKRRSAIRGSMALEVWRRSEVSGWWSSSAADGHCLIASSFTPASPKEVWHPVQEPDRLLRECRGHTQRQPMRQEPGAVAELSSAPSLC